MNVWTDGYRLVYLNTRGLHVIDGEDLDSYGKLALSDDATRSCMAVSPDGEQIWLRTEEGHGARIRLEKGKVETFDWDLLAATYHGHKLLVCTRRSEGARLRVHEFDPQLSDEDDLDEFEIETGSRVEWPEVIWESGDEPWQRYTFGKSDAYAIDHISLTTNRFGTVLVDRLSGLLALMRHDADEFGWTGRVPADEDVNLYAEATQEGVLVSINRDGKEGAILHVDEKGRCRSTRAFWALGSSLVLGRDLIVVPAARTYGQDEMCVRVMSLRHMEERQTLDMPFDADPREFAAFGRRTEFAMAGPEDLIRGVRGRAEWELESVEWLPAEEIEEEALEEESKPAVTDIPFSNREPEVGFPAGRKPKTWSGKSSKPLKLILDVRSGGKPGRGLIVWLSGDALENELVSAGEASVGDTTGTFEEKDGKFMATLDVALPPGVIYPWQSKPKDKDAAEQALDDSHLELELTLEAERKGSELLTVEVSAKGQGSAIKWMRPVTID